MKKWRKMRTTRKVEAVEDIVEIFEQQDILRADSSNIH